MGPIIVCGAVGVDSSTFVWRYGFLVHLAGVVLPPEELTAVLSEFSLPDDDTHLLTPRAAPLSVVSVLTAPAHLLRVADLYAYDSPGPLSSTSVPAIESQLSARWRQVSDHGKIHCRTRILSAVLRDRLAE